MKKELVISTSPEDLLKEFSDEMLFEFFKAKVKENNPGNFTFEINKDSNLFIARKEENNLTDSLNLNQKLKDFISLNYDRSGRLDGAGTRSFNCLIGFLNNDRESMTIIEFLNMPRKSFEVRNFGKKAFRFMKEEFERLGIKTSSYPFFK